MLRRLSEGGEPSRPELPDGDRPSVVANLFLVCFAAAVATLFGGYAWLLLPEELTLIDKARVLVVVAIAAVLLGVAAVLLGRSAGSGPINYE